LILWAKSGIDCQEVVGDANSENMIIKGDNLLALKSLLPYYANAVKMIYIDPPYNTGNTSWIYNDNMGSPLIKKWLDNTVNAEDLSRSDKWLCMMYPRLKLLRELLKEDGVIFISIDDAEVAHLRMICDEIFGAENFIANIIWKHTQQSKNDEPYFSRQNNATLSYRKSSELKQLRFERTEKDNKNYSNPDNDINGKWRSGDVRSPSYRKTLCFNIITPSGNIISPPENGWRWKEEEIQRKIDIDEIIFNNDETKIIRKIYLKNQNGRTPENVWFGDEFGTTREANNELKDIFNKANFDTPKPTKLIRKMLQLCTSNNDIILDSFAGSGTTAHAVIEQNRADGGNRKFILIETLDYAKEITAERVKRVQQGYAFKGKDKTTLYEKKITTTQLLKAKTMETIATEVETLIEKEKPNYTKIEKTFKDNLLKVVGIKDIESFKEGLGGGFKYCELGVEIFDEFGELNSELTFRDIAKHVYFVEFKIPLQTKELEAQYIGSHKKRHLYFFEERFKIANMKKLVREQEAYKEMIVYTRKCSISNDELKKHKITVRYIPYDIKNN